MSFRPSRPFPPGRARRPRGGATGTSGPLLPRELVLFAGIGVLNTALDFAVFTLCVHGFGWPLVAANVAAWSVAVSFSYGMNGRWTFARSRTEILRVVPYARFALGNALSLVVATTALVLLSDHAPVSAAKLASMVLGFAINFVVGKYLTFGARGD